MVIKKIIIRIKVSIIILKSPVIIIIIIMMIRVVMKMFMQFRLMRPENYSN